MPRRYSSEYKNLQPYVVEDARKVANAVLTSLQNGGGTVGVTDHGALTGLSDDDHPQYLTPVRGDARYIPATRQVIAGAGLTGGGDLTADRTFVVGAGLGITVNADDVALTTPGTLTVSSTNSSTGSHTHAITASSDVGTTPAAALLKSTGSGALTLAYLAVKGSVDITNNGDLTVAGSGSYAGNTVLFVDSSGGNVGIMRTPDPQFALDIAGPARADYWVGPHAIQLKNVMLLSHFDGRLPYETNFYGEPNGHMGQIATVAGSVVYRPGKFYKAVQTGPTALNRCTNPSFETNTTGWTYNDSNASGSMTRTSYNSYVGSFSLQLFNNNSGEDDFAFFNVAGLSAGTAYTVSAYAYVTDEYGGAATSNRGLYALDTNSAGTAQTSTITGSTSGTWVRHTVTVTMSGSPGNLQIRLYNPKGRTYWDAVQVEQSGGATGYADGSMPGHTWTGTAHASTSNRTTTAYLTYPTTGNINPLRGTIMAWVYPYSSFGAAYFWRITGAVAGNIILRTNGGNLEAFWGTSQITGTGALTGNAWQHVAITYDSVTLRLYVNGTQVASGASSGFDTLPANMYLGIADGTNGPMAALIDDFCILERAAPATEIKSIYESNAPVFAESSTFSFRPTPKGLVWADDEGLWVKATDGDTVLGVYCNDVTTKSWGGQTMSAGDVLIGNATNYLFWNDDVATLTIAGNGAGMTSINGGNIQTGTVTATQLSVTTLSAISANMGSLTSGSIVIGSTNKIWLNESADGALNIGGSTKASAPFRVTAAGALTATSATITGSIGATGGGVISGNWYVGYDVSYAGSMYFGSGGKARVGTNGMSLVMESLGSSPTIPTSSSALRWFPDISESYTHTNAKNYSGIIGYKHTGITTIDNIWTAYVGSTDYATYAARVMIQAGHMDGSSVYTDARLEVVREAGSGLRYVGIFGDRLEVNGAIGAATMTAPGASWAGGSLIYTDTADGDLKVRFANGTVKTLATN